MAAAACVARAQACAAASPWPRPRPPGGVTWPLVSPARAAIRSPERTRGCGRPRQSRIHRSPRACAKPAGPTDGARGHRQTMDARTCRQARGCGAPGAREETSGSEPVGPAGRPAAPSRRCLGLGCGEQRLGGGDPHIGVRRTSLLRNRLSPRAASPAEKGGAGRVISGLERPRTSCSLPGSLLPSSRAFQTSLGPRTMCSVQSTPEASLKHRNTKMPQNSF